MGVAQSTKKDTKRLWVRFIGVHASLILHMPLQIHLIAGSGGLRSHV